jgi:hypothetical protein
MKLSLKGPILVCPGGLDDNFVFIATCSTSLPPFSRIVIAVSKADQFSLPFSTNFLAASQMLEPSLLHSELVLMHLLLPSISSKIFLFGMSSISL